MTPSHYVLTPAEKRFRLWMWLSFWMYTLGIPLFLLFGRQVAAFLNGLPRSLVHLPPYPAAGTGMEVVFWQVLGVSLMGILGVLCLYIARDVRRFGPMINALLCAKLISTVCYAFLFLGSGNLAYVVAVLTDGSIFLLSWTLWFLASPAERLLDAWETRVLSAIGTTLLPKDGPYPAGYADVEERCIADAERFLAAHASLDIAAVRLMLRLFDLLPLCLLYFRSFHTLAFAERVTFFERLEQSRIGPLRLTAIALKLYVVIPFFNPAEPEPGMKPRDESA
jgi:hypothetical protein